MEYGFKRWAVHLVWMATAAAAAQPASVQVPATASDALHTMADRAGVIFVGTVSRIHRIAGDGQSSGAVEITFTVEEPVKGCASGSDYTVREWAGLWANTDRRYRVGQRLLMLLHSPGPAGFSGPVDGTRGAIPVLGTAPAVGPASTTAQSAADTQTADLRWISAAGVARPLPIAAPASFLAGVHGSPVRVSARAQGAAGSQIEPRTASAAPGTAASNAPAGEPVHTLLRRLAEWEASHAE